MSVNATSTPTSALISRAICCRLSPKRPRGYSAPSAGVYGCFWIGLQHLDGFERLRAGAAQRPVDRLGVHALERFGAPCVADLEIAQALHRDRRIAAAQRCAAGSGRGDRRATATAVPVGVGSARFSQPSSVDFRPGVPDSM